MKRREYWVGCFIVCALTLAACVNDFDALFDGAGGGSGKTDGGPSSGSSSSSSGDTGSGDDDDQPAPLDSGTPDGKVGADPTQTCGAKQTTCQDLRQSGPQFSVINACTGCGCSCPAFDCEQAEGVCTTTCAGGASCTGSCSFQDDCELTVKASVANFTCRGSQFTGCNLSCTQGSICTFDCRDARKCNVTCEAGSSCNVKLCFGDGCRVDTCPNKKTCGDGSISCGDAPCPK